MEQLTKAKLPTETSLKSSHPNKTSTPSQSEISALSPAEGSSLYETTSGIIIKRLYANEDAPLEKLLLNEQAGSFPFTRGLYPKGYLEKLWTMRMYSGFGSSRQTNQRFHYLINHGETGLSLAFDLPTQIGFDPDHASSKGEVGKVGVSVSGIWDFEKLFSGIDLERVSVSMTINATGFILYALYLVLAKKRGVDLKTLRGTIQNDILKEYIARGTQAYPLEPSMRITTDLIEFSLKHTPQFYPISISGYHIREAGACAVDEIAFTLANAFSYLEALQKRGVAPENALSRLSFFFGVHNSMLEEVAKFRAARKVWAEMVQERFHIKEPKLLHLRFHAQTCGSTLVKEEPLNNAVRVALQALYATLGGCQSLHTNSYDEAISIPSEAAHLLALRTQQMLACETGIADCVDPLGGSYAIETLTEEIASRCKNRIQEIHKMGGMFEAISMGFPQRAIEEAAFRQQKEMERSPWAMDKMGTGGSKKGTLSKVRAFRIKPEIEKEVVRELKKQKRQRKEILVKQALHDLSLAAKSKENILPPTIRAIENKATLGEIAQILREEFGGWHGGSSL